MDATALRLHCIRSAICGSVRSLSRNSFRIRFNSSVEKYLPCDRIISVASCLPLDKTLGRDSNTTFFLCAHDFLQAVANTLRGVAGVDDQVAVVDNPLIIDFRMVRCDEDYIVAA